MRRISLWFLSTVAVVMLLFGYHTSTSGPAVAASPSVTPAPATPGTSGTSGSSGTSTGGGTTVTGAVAQTRWGPVQVQITVAAGKITNVDVLQYPNGNGHDQQINDYALPILTQATVSAQSANIDMVSGATVTSDGYVQSLQSALDQAGLR
jgi:uncharacterized protein with FMN-binding domain